MVTTDGHLLGGRVAYRQPSSGFRSSIEPVLLAASVPAQAGEHVLEAGTGAGAALLCLCARVDGVQATGVEVDETMAALAVANAQANGFSRMEIIAGRIETAILSQRFHHAFANPPYHRSDGSPSPHTALDIAKRGSDSLLEGWIKRLSASLRRRGSLTLIVPAGMVPTCLNAMLQSHCPCTALYPLWPKHRRPAKLVLVRGVKNARTPMRLLPGLVLHQANGSFSDSAQAILRDAAALPLDA
jgi:tRNA1(Val) A37 N6-methylase TrmN6